MANSIEAGLSVMQGAGQVRSPREVVSLSQPLADLLVSFAANDGEWRVAA